MSNSPLYRFIQEDFGIEGRGKWYHSEHHDSLVYNADDDFFFWNSKDIKGGALEYLIHVRGMEKEQARNFLKNSVGAIKENSSPVNIKPYEKLVELMWDRGKNERDYWYRRCLKDETIDRYKLGFYNGWSLIPIYENGEFVNFQCRRDTPSKSMFFWYGARKVYLFNEGILPFVKTVFITEGMVDCILLNQEGFPSVCACGANSWMDKWFPKFSNIQNIYYLEDNDTAGRQGARKVANSLGIGKVKIVSFSEQKEKYDTGDFFKDGGTKEIFREYVEKNNRYLFQLENIYGRKSELGKSRKLYPSWR